MSDFIGKKEADKEMAESMDSEDEMADKEVVDSETDAIEETEEKDGKGEGEKEEKEKEGSDAENALDVQEGESGFPIINDPLLAQMYLQPFNLQEDFHLVTAAHEDFRISHRNLATFHENFAAEIRSYRAVLQDFSAQLETFGVAVQYLREQLLMRENAHDTLWAAHTLLGDAHTRLGLAHHLLIALNDTRESNVDKAQKPVLQMETEVVVERNKKRAAGNGKKGEPDDEDDEDFGKPAAKKFRKE